MANLHNFPTLSLDNPIFEPCSRHWAVAAKHRTTKTRDMPFVGILPSNWDLAWLHFTDARLGVASFIYRLLRDFSESIRGEKERSGSCCAFYMSPVEGEKISCIYVWLQKYKLGKKVCKSYCRPMLASFVFISARSDKMQSGRHQKSYIALLLTASGGRQ